MLQFAISFAANSS